MTASNSESVLSRPQGSDRGTDGVGDANGAQIAICACGHRVTWHHDTRGCEYYGTSPERRCPCRLSSDDAVAAIVREHRAEVLAEVERRIAASVSPNFALRPDGTEDPTTAVYVEGLRDAHAIVRDYRQEQNHA